MQRTQIYLPKIQIDALRKVAQKEKTTVSGMIRIFVDQGLARKNVPKKRQTRDAISGFFKTLEEIKKMGEKGPRDLARNMDKYLYGGK